MGFIGLNLARKLASSGVQVELCDNLFRAPKDEFAKQVLENRNVHFIKADLSNESSFSRLGKYDFVYHLAAINGTKYFYEIPDRVLRTNILLCLNLLDWFKDSKKGKILFSSSSETYAGTVEKFSGKVPTPEGIELCIDDPYNARWSYGGSKIAGELLFINYARMHKFPMSIIRYHNVYGPRMGFEHVIPQFIQRVHAKENPFRVFGARNTRAFCYIDDAVEATQLVMESAKTNFGTFNIGNSSEEVSIMELAKKLFAIARYGAKITEQPSPEGSVSRRCPDMSKTEAAVGYFPKVALVQGLEKTFNWYWDYYNKTPAAKNMGE